MPKKYSEDELMELAKTYVEQAEKDAEMNPASDQIQVVVVEPQKKPYKKNKDLLVVILKSLEWETLKQVVQWQSH